MRYSILVIAIGVVFSGCQKEKEQLQKFIYDSNQIEYRDVHQYAYDENGRIKVDRMTTYLYKAGRQTDSITSETVFEHNGKGQLVLAFDRSDSSRQVKVYNSVDSLVGDYRINALGDTTHLAIIVYDQNKIIQRINRDLSMRLPEDFEDIKREDLQNYDTLLFTTDLIYDGGIHVRSISRDNGEVTETEHHYDGDKLVKTITYAFLGDMKYVRETTYHEQFPGGESDFVSIGTQGDTIGFAETTIEDGMRIVNMYNANFDTQDVFYYDSDGQLLATEIVDLKEMKKTVSEYTYDKRGNIKEDITYREMLLRQ